MASFNHPSIPTSNSGSRSATFGRSFIRNMLNRLPLSKSNVIDDISEYNPKFQYFDGLSKRREELIQRQSITTPKVAGRDDSTYGSMVVDKTYQQLLYAAIDLDKAKRLREYRVMAAYSELADAIDEICDECIVRSDKCGIISHTVEGEYSNEIRKEIDKEFKKYIGHFKLEENGWQYFRSMLIDGEVYFEHIIKEDKLDAGVLGVVDIPTSLINPIYDNVQNLVVKGFMLKHIVLDPTTQKEMEEEYIPLAKNQIAYINSGMWNEDKSIRLPFIENARRPYKLLSLLEDSIVIYRLVRAPERLVFNVDTGTMPTPQAESYLKRLMQQYWSKKTYDGSQGRGVNVYDPQSMLDSFWFAKKQGSEGTTVSQLQGGQNLGQLEDLFYFQRKLYKSLKVPTSRLEKDAGYSDGAEITREELRFAKFIIRLQTQFAAGLKEGFITHLKLRGLWSQYKLRESAIKLEFTPPTSFHKLRDQQVREIEFNNYTTMAGANMVSARYCQKKYLNWSDTEIIENMAWMKKDAEAEWELGQIQQNGPNWKEVYKAAADAEGGVAGGDIGGGSGLEGGLAGSGSELPPDFGPGPNTAGMETGDIPEPTGEEPEPDEEDTEEPEPEPENQ